MSGGDGMDSTLEYILSDACGFLLLCPFVPGDQGRCSPRPGVGDAFCCGKPPSTFDQGPRSLPQVNERCERGRQVVKSHLPMLIIGCRSDGVDRS
jgi:hypothetical protein